MSITVGEILALEFLYELATLIGCGMGELAAIKTNKPIEFRKAATETLASRVSEPCQAYIEICALKRQRRIRDEWIDADSD